VLVAADPDDTGVDLSPLPSWSLGEDVRQVPSAETGLSAGQTGFVGGHVPLAGMGLPEGQTGVVGGQVPPAGAGSPSSQ
jgi:hypothetical protein